jgi:predicted ATP-grasp superfamily ATP-dependent carboligase
LSIRTEPGEEYKRLEEKRRSLEEKTRILEEKAQAEKLAVDKKLLVQILEEENLTHNDAVKELEGRIANLEQQLQPSSTIESTSTETPPEPVQEISQDIDDGVDVSVLPQPEQNEAEVSEKGSKKKRRNFF